MWLFFKLCRAMKKKLALSPYTKEIHKGDKYIFINPNKPCWIVTNQLGKIILSLFDGRLCRDEIIKIATEGIGVSKQEVITEFCNKVIMSGLLENIPPNPKQHRYNLSSVHLSLSDHCNLNCSYCYARERKEHQVKSLTYEDYTRTIDDILTISNDVVFTLTGGEPLLNKKCFEIAQYIKSKNQKVYLLTNGTLITENNILFIKELFDLVTISIDGPNERIHSLTRGSGNYKNVIRAIELLEDNSVEFTLSMTVTKLNIDYVEEMALKYGGKLNFAPYFPISGEVSNLAISGLEYYEALKKAYGVNPLGYCESSLNYAMSSPCHKCAIGDGEFSISATGDVYPCQLLHTDNFFAGNIHEQSIIDIYNNSDIIKKCALLDVDTMDGCKDCSIKYICGGACRARSYYGCKDINSSSDFCDYEKSAYYDGIINIYSKNTLI